MWHRSPPHLYEKRMKHLAQQLFNLPPETHIEIHLSSGVRLAGLKDIEAGGAILTLRKGEGAETVYVDVDAIIAYSVPAAAAEKVEMAEQAQADLEDRLMTGGSPVGA
jgi:hypothetical protein